MHPGALLLLMTSLSIPAVAQARGGSADFAAVQIPSDVPAEQIVLRITGSVAGGSISLDLATVQAFPQVTFTSVDPWVGASHEFSGVLLLPLLQRLGMAASATVVEVLAANAYKAAIRVPDMKDHPYLLVYRMDGKLMRDTPEMKKRGTLMIAIDFDARKDLDVEVYKHHLVWQVVAIEVR
jgi:hypothetical protein